MSKPIRTEKEADEELAEALRSYEEKRSGLGNEFLAAIDDVLNRVSRFPEIGAAMPNAPESLGVRRIPVRKFPYQVVYLDTPEAIRILAFAHNRRRPFYWLSRSASRR